MKKLFFLFTLALFLTSCGGSEPTIPDDAIVAVCPQGDTFKYIYKDDTVYEFYSNDVLQDEGMLGIVQSAVDSTGTVRDYIDATFVAGVCTFTDYAPPVE
ncbi:hypothetical protein KQ51_01350 [Candidatus Izimaplasma bacterium HR1]|jgi:hypothetical protein|uniref:hypothetical protein n=1 Tax=Candidatus Izimoplasma sp. HR1 TaxID=1541959 RepID=UPI0004F58FE3|nr:hypothetical protein KQ51_01350 [Candidatus Izimaplasma bacterium HR1]